MPSINWYAIKGYMQDMEGHAKRLQRKGLEACLVDRVRAVEETLAAHKQLVDQAGVRITQPGMRVPEGFVVPQERMLALYVEQVGDAKLEQIQEKIGELETAQLALTNANRMLIERIAGRVTAPTPHVAQEQRTEPRNIKGRNWRGQFIKATAAPVPSPNIESHSRSSQPVAPATDNRQAEEQETIQRLGDYWRNTTSVTSVDVTATGTGPYYSSDETYRAPVDAHDADQNDEADEAPLPDDFETYDEDEADQQGDSRDEGGNPGDGDGHGAEGNDEGEDDNNDDHNGNDHESEDDSSLTSGESQDSAPDNSGPRGRGRGHPSTGPDRITAPWTEVQRHRLNVLYNKHHGGSKLRTGVMKKIARAFNKWTREQNITHHGRQVRRTPNGLRQEARKMYLAEEITRDKKRRASRSPTGRPPPHPVLRTARPTARPPPPADDEDEDAYGDIVLDRSNRSILVPRPPQPRNEASQTSPAQQPPAQITPRPSLQQPYVHGSLHVSPNYTSTTEPPTAVSPQRSSPSNSLYSLTPPPPPQESEIERQRRLRRAAEADVSRQSRIDGPIAAYNRDRRERKMRHAHDTIWGRHRPGCGCGQP